MRTATLALLMAAVGSGQRTPQFDVVSIKPSRSNDHGGSMIPIAGGLAARNLSVSMLIQSAYNLKQWQILGGPGWVTTDCYDIEAQAEGNPTLKEKLEMFGPLLAERFRLNFHRETRQMPSYSLTVAKSGPKLSATASGVKGYFRPGRGLIEGRGVTMRVLADLLGGSLGQSVTDTTGITGSFNIRLEWTPSLGEPDYKYDDRAIDSNGPSIFTAIQQQLGLKLNASKGPIDVLVIDHVERPSDN